MYAALDIGGTNIRLALFKSLLRPRMIKALRLPVSGKYQRDINSIIGILKNLGGLNFKGIGVSIAGVLDKNKRRLINSPNLIGWNLKPLKQDLKKAFGCSVVLENDAVAAALAEATFGYGVKKDFVFIIWGTGLGGAAVEQQGNRPRIIPLEPGHQIFKWDGQAHSCGQRGCLEQYVAGAGIEKLYKKRPQDLGAGEWREVIKNFAQGLVNVVILRPTQLVVLSGSLAIKQARRLKQIQRLVKKRLKIISPPRRIVVSKLGENAGLYGALALLRTSSRR